MAIADHQQKQKLTQPSSKHAEPPACATPAVGAAMQPPKQDQEEHAETTKPEKTQEEVAIRAVNAGEEDDGSADIGRRCVCSAAGQPAGHFRCVRAETDVGDD